MRRAAVERNLSCAMQQLPFTEISRRLAGWRFPENVDGVVGIAHGGVVPAAMVAQLLGVEMKVISMNYRDDGNVPRFPEPRLLAAAPDLGSWRRVLLVDDVWVSGRSWHSARGHLPAAVDVLPFVFKGKVEFALFADLDGCVHWPWKTA